VGNLAAGHARQTRTRAKGFDEPLSGGELASVIAICNRVSRILGLLDREGLQRDIAIVQANCPVNLEGLAAAPDSVFVEELMGIIDATDRSTGSLKGSFRSRFRLE
jgi:hypothetical protein